MLKEGYDLLRNVVLNSFLMEHHSLCLQCSMVNPQMYPGDTHYHSNPKHGEVCKFCQALICSQEELYWHLRIHKERLNLWDKKKRPNTNP